MYARAITLEARPRVADKQAISMLMRAQAITLETSLAVNSVEFGSDLRLVLFDSAGEPDTVAYSFLLGHAQKHSKTFKHADAGIRANRYRLLLTDKRRAGFAERVAT